MDIAFTRKQVAVQVLGCFWHGCPEHASWPKANAEWWRAKIERNIERDRDTARRLRETGWELVVVWEHEPVEEAVERVVSVLRHDA